MTATGPLLHAAIRHCQFLPSGVDRDQVEDVFITTLGCSKACLLTLRPEEHTADKDEAFLEQLELMTPVLFQNEMSRFYMCHQPLCFVNI